MVDVSPNGTQPEQDRTNLIKSWSGRWHLFEKTLPGESFQAISADSGVTERRRGLTTCGEIIYIGAEISTSDIAVADRLMRRGCKKCKPVVFHRINALNTEESSLEYVD